MALASEIQRLPSLEGNSNEENILWLDRLGSHFNSIIGSALPFLKKHGGPNTSR